MSAREPSESVPLPRTWGEWWALPLALARRGVVDPPARRRRRAVLRGALFFVAVAALAFALGEPVALAELAPGAVAIALVAALVTALAWVELWAGGRPASLWPDLKIALASSLASGLVAGAIGAQHLYTRTLLRTGSLQDALAATYDVVTAPSAEGLVVVLVGAQVAGALLLFRLGRPLAALLWANVSIGPAVVVIQALTLCDAIAVAIEDRWPAPAADGATEPPA